MFSNLLENPKLFRHVVEDLPVGIYIVDRDLRIRFWNRGAEHLTGHLAHGESFLLHKEDMAKLKTELQGTIQQMNGLEKVKKNIEMTVTAEGLRIELLESEKGTFFESESSALNQNGREMVTLLAAELGKVPNRVSVEGHTDAKPFTGKSSYSNWELSSDRANAARPLMQESGLRGDQVSQVRGFADQRLRNVRDPHDPSNRRISIIVQYINPTSDAADGPAEGAKGPGTASKKE